MALRILVIGRGGDAVRVGNDHELEFKLSALTGEGGIIDIKGYDFVFLHLSTRQKEAVKAIEKWDSKKIVGYSGGVIKEVWHQYKLHSISNLEDREAIINLNWHAIPIDFDKSVGELIKLLTRRLELLSVLAILCQGYLAVHARARGLKNIKEALDQMGWPAFAESTAGVALLGANEEREAKKIQVAETKWWTEVVNMGEPEMKESLEAECEGELAKPIEELVTAIFKGDIPERIVAAGYCAIAKRLGGEPCPS